MTPIIPNPPSSTSSASLTPNQVPDNPVDTDPTSGVDESQSADMDLLIGSEDLPPVCPFPVVRTVKTIFYNAGRLEPLPFPDSDD